MKSIMKFVLMTVVVVALIGRTIEASDAVPLKVR